MADARIETLSDTSALAWLAEQALAEGRRIVPRLVAEWEQGLNRFSEPGERLYGAWVDKAVVGVCGLNIDPFAADRLIGRVRRMYVAPSYRRRGIGSMLLRQVIADAAGTFDELRLFTENEIADAFYRKHGFGRVEGIDHCSHRLCWETEGTSAPSPRFEGPLTP